jgi:hypothetical protein
MLCEPFINSVFVVGEIIILLSTSHYCAKWCDWCCCVIVTKYCASVCCMNLFSLMKLVWHNYTIIYKFSTHQCSLAMHFTYVLQPLSGSWQWGWGTTTTSFPSAYTGWAYVDGCWKLAHVGWGYALDGQPWWSPCLLGTEPNQYNSFKDFMDTKPPIFREVEEPL